MAQLRRILLAGPLTANDGGCSTAAVQVYPESGRAGWNETGSRLRDPASSHAPTASHLGGRGEVLLVGYEVSQFLAGLEDRHRPGSHLDRVPGARIARHPGLPLPDLERAE